MTSDEKAFLRKVHDRKYAIENSWRGSSEGAAAPSRAQQPADDTERRWEALAQNIAEADACKQFDGYLPVTSHRRILGKAVVFLKRAQRKLLKIFWGWYIFPQYQRLSHFHGKILNAVCLEQELLSKAVQEGQALSARVDQQGAQLSERLDQQGAQMAEQLDQQGVQLAERMDQQAASIADRFAQMEQRITRLAEENEQLRARLKKVEDLPTDDDTFYHDFEEAFRGSQELIRDRLRVYVPLLEERLPDWTHRRFVDVGSGRGEWLDILRENGASDYVGVDLNARQNALCQARGHHTVQMDCIQYLKDLPAESVDLVTGFQIIEHLCLSDLVSLLQQSHRVLRPGGCILFETPNPRNLTVGADTFYLDPSHKRPLEPRLVAFLAEWCGYADVQCIDANSDPASSRIPLPDTEDANYALIKQFNDVKWLLYGPRDYAVFAVKE